MASAGGGGRRRHARRSLACFVSALEGSRVVVELRYDTVVRGRLVASDDHLNLQLEEASIQPLQGARREASYLYVKGRHVRFIHLPGNLEPAAAIEQHRKRVAAAARQHALAQQQAAAAAGRPQKGAQLEFAHHESGSSAAGVGAAGVGAGDAMETD